MIKTPYAGVYYVYVHAPNSESDFIYQDVDVVEYAGYIDAGQVRANISAAAGTHTSYGFTRLQFMFLDENKDVLATILDTDYDIFSEWVKFSLSEEFVPLGTRYIRVWGNAYGLYGTAAGVFDAFSVKVNILEN